LDLMSWDSFNAVQSLIESAQVLEAIYTPSRIKIVNMLCGIYDTDALYAVTQLKVAEAIRDLEGEKQGLGVPIQDIAHKVGTNPLKLDPILVSFQTNMSFVKALLVTTPTTAILWYYYKITDPILPHTLKLSTMKREKQLLE